MIEKLAEIYTEFKRQGVEDPLTETLRLADILSGGSLRDADVSLLGKETDFYRAKVMQATYFTGVTLPLTLARLETCTREAREVVEMPEEAF